MPNDMINGIRIDAEYEEANISRTVAVVERNCSAYESECDKLKVDIEEMREHFHDGDTEIWVTLNNAITMYENTFAALKRASRAKSKPYFGRIVFTDETGERTESLYIGRSGVNDGPLNILVTDWRAPVANAYYENGLGKCIYRGPAGDKFKLDLKLKRTFDVEDGRLTGFFDSEAAANDELLNKYLARNKQAVLGEIIATIQKEQNDIIRKAPYHNVLVQGAAGSGKTTVAMHRISYILYNFADRIKPSDFYIIGSNKMLLNYITGVLPELDVEGIRQMTMEELLVRLLYEQWDDSAYAVRPLDVNDTTAFVRGSSKWYSRLEEFFDGFESRFFKIEDIRLNPACFVEGIEGGKSGVHDRSDVLGDTGSVVLMKGEYIARYIRENPTVSLQNKVRNLNERLLDNVNQELLRKDITYTQREKAAIVRAFTNYFGPSEYKGSVYDLYDIFLESEGRPAGGKKLESCESSFKAGASKNKRSRAVRGYDVYELAALAYIYKRVIETEVISEAHHIVIDEAQDYGMMAYRVLDRCIRECTYTIMGDTSQNIRYDFGINDWSELTSLMIRDRKDSFCMLRKSYRNTIEISHFATGILDHGTFDVYPVEPIIRHGEEPELLRTEAGSLYGDIADICREWQEEGLATIAVVCRDEAQAAEVSEGLGSLMTLLSTDPESAEFGAGVMVLPVSMTKGLEFDAVCVCDPDRDRYPVDDRHAKLLYVAVTRALHRLCIVHTGNLTGLIADEAKGTSRHVTVEHVAEEEHEAEFDKEGNDAAVKSMILNKATVHTKEVMKNAAPAGTSAVAAVGSMAGSTAYRSASKAASSSASGSPVNAASKKASDPETDSKTDLGEYLTEVPDGRLKYAGHSSPDLGIKWTSKNPDGMHFTSRFGVLRVCAVSPQIFRITFTRGTVLEKTPDLGLKQYRMMKDCTVKESGPAFELNTSGLCVSVDRHNGAISFKDRSKKEILSERKTEGRYIGSVAGTTMSSVFFTINSSDTVRGYNPVAGETNFIPNNTARYFSIPGRIPMLTLKDKIGIIPLTKEPCCVCRIVSYGGFVRSQGEYIDYYVVLGADKEELIRQYNNLTGEI